MNMKADLFFIIIFFSALNTAIYYMAQKWGWIDYLKIKTKIKMLFNLLSCEFCIFFWLAMIELNTLYFIHCHVQYFVVMMIIPFSLCCSVFSKFFLRSNQ